MKKTHTNYVRHAAKALVIVLIAGSQMAPTCDQSHSGDHNHGNTVVQYRAFGDSIPAGNLGSGSSSSDTSNYVNYYAEMAAETNGWHVVYEAKTVSGETTSQINSTMNSNTSKMAVADIFTFNAGGNDLLKARDSNGCSDVTLGNAVNTFRNAWNNVINTVATYVPENALIRTMTIYYPDPNDDKSTVCGSGFNKFEMLLPHGLAVSDYMCSTAEARGWGCADALKVMNCDQDANGITDPRCPNVAYLKNLAATDCPRGANGMMDYECIRSHLDATGDWAYFKDPTLVSKGGSYRNLVQSGDIHPNSEGHSRIAEAHHDLGYDNDCEPICTGDECGQSDGCGGTCPSTAANTCNMCGNPGPDCSGDQCGQSDGCGGTCPDTDANECGMCGNPGMDCSGDQCGQADGCGGNCPSTDVNECGMCGNPAADCSGDQCGQSNGCGGTCPDTDANECGKCGNAACEGLNEVLSGSSGSLTRRSFDGTDPTVSISGGSGDADLYVKLGSAPTTSSYDCRPYASGNNEDCDMSGTGTWHVMVRAYSTYSNVTLVSSDGGGDDGGGGGGTCTNTCNYASDGECDDGGPGSQYSVCALGTDCADCGPR